MPFPLIIPTLLPWLVFLQGILLACIVLSRGQYKSNRYLGILLVLLSLHGLVTLVWLNPDKRMYAEIYVGMGALPFFYGPLIYRYIWHSLYRDVNDRIPLAVHFIPGILDFLFYLIFYLIIGRTSFLRIAEEVIAGHRPFYVAFLEWTKILYGLFYCLLVIRLFSRHWNALKKRTSGEKHKRWLIALLTVFTLNWVLVLISGFFLWTGRYTEELNTALSGLQLIAFLAFMYTLAFFALRFPVILEPKDVREEIRKKLNLPDGFIDETLRRLEKAERQHFYNDTEVTLTSLAGDLGVHPNAFSYIINETKGVSFRQYLNRLRIGDFLIRVREDKAGQSLLTHAFNAGFASKSTFLRAFKTEFALTPQEFLTKEGIKTHTEGFKTHTETP